MRSRRRRLARQRKSQARYSVTVASLNAEYWDDWDDIDDLEFGDDEDFDPDGPGSRCHYCHGEGYGIVGLDWDCADGINGPYNGEIEKCPCCHGSGKAEDCTFW